MGETGAESTKGTGRWKEAEGGRESGGREEKEKEEIQEMAERGEGRKKTANGTGWQEETTVPPHMLLTAGNGNHTRMRWGERGRRNEKLRTYSGMGGKMVRRASKRWEEGGGSVRRRRYVGRVSKRHRGRGDWVISHGQPSTRSEDGEGTAGR